MARRRCGSCVSCQNPARKKRCLGGDSGDDFQKKDEVSQVPGVLPDGFVRSFDHDVSHDDVARDVVVSRDITRENLGADAIFTDTEQTLCSNEENVVSLKEHPHILQDSDISFQRRRYLIEGCVLALAASFEQQAVNPSAALGPVACRFFEDLHRGEITDLELQSFVLSPNFLALKF